jgi:hypothetical protein
MLGGPKAEHEHGISIKGAYGSENPTKWQEYPRLMTRKMTFSESEVWGLRLDRQTTSFSQDLK